MSNKLKIGVVFGGKSPEHNISLLSARNVIDNIDRSQFDVVLLAIDKTGVWHYIDGELQLSNPGNAQTVALPKFENTICLSQNSGDHSIIDQATGECITKIDVLYPVLHGAFGEDGAIQGLAKVAGLPCVGCGILGSSAGMDKDVTKRLLRDSGIGIADFITLRKGYNEHLKYDEIKQKIGGELFIKPANLGSSVGVSFVDNEEDFIQAVKTGFEYDPKVIVEEKITGREIECAVLGNERPEASVIGEILPKTEWYTFENKYIDDDGAGLEIPAKLTEEETERARTIAIDTYINLECCGLTRVDMFLKTNGEIIVNEVNTLPGFTQISMFPKLWEHSGLKYQALITKLIQLALDKFENENKLKI
ncbi:MAG: D-alanine--D-alanine ligase [Saprospiraceae bacterium]|nr:D-alanine--D-alanine ligase [Saprospiraceae bacterium]